MSDRSPYVLLAFANPLRVPEEYLHFLTRESNLIYEHLESLAIEDSCDINRIPNATVEQVFNMVEKWKQRKDLILFHFGGHASGGQLLLTTNKSTSRAANAEGLATLLGSLPSLQLVFLNGCSTKGQVSMLLDKGVKAVIATSVPIQDEMAVDFASRFYQNFSSGETLAVSFEQARTFIKTKYTYEVLSPSESRDIVFDRKLADTPQDELAWGLYIREGEEDILQWKLPDKGSNPNSKAYQDLEENLQQEIKASGKLVKWALPVGALVGMLLLATYFFIKDDFLSSSRGFNMEVSLYRDNAQTLPVQQGKIEVYYENAPNASYSIQNGKIELKDLRQGLRGDTIQINPTIEGIKKGLISVVLPEEGSTVSISLPKEIIETTVRGSIFNKDGSGLTNALVLIGTDSVRTNQLGDFQLRLPVKTGSRQRVRIFVSDKEVYNGEELISDQPINLKLN